MAEADEIERMRRALYRPGVTEADRAHYAAAAPAVAPEPDAPAPPRRSVRRVLPIAAVLVAGVGIVLWPLVQAPASDAPPSAPPEASPSTAVFGGPFRAGEPRSDVEYTGVEYIGVEYTDAGVVQRFRGRGPAAVALDRDLMPADGGALSVVLTPSRTASVYWRVIREGATADSPDALIATRSVRERRGAADPILFPFDGPPPTTVAVRVSADVGWSLVVTAVRGAAAR